MTTFLWILGIVAVAVVVFAVRTHKTAAPKKPTFVCDRCGEHHCECHLETDNEP